MGIELGSTRIKAVLIDGCGKVLAQGGHAWENRYENGIWTYHMDDVLDGLQDCYADLSGDVAEKYGVRIESLKGIGISAMMHGYLAFGKDMDLLVPFRTWRNTISEQASDVLTEELDFNMPQRWSSSNFYQAMLNKEEHVKDVRYLTTLAGYIHYRLTGEYVLGIGDASGMFPVDSRLLDYDEGRLARFDALAGEMGFDRGLKTILPKTLCAGESAGYLTKEGASLLDPTGALKSGIPFCPPEGDAGTGMVATNSVAVRTGNVSAGTSVFGMLVLEKPLSKVYKELDLVTTPSGDPVAMAHCNNCTGDINAWMRLFSDVAEAFGSECDSGRLYETMFKKALEGDADCGGIVSYNFDSGEHTLGLNEGRPLFVRSAGSAFTLANFMRNLIYSSISALKIGMDIMLKDEGVKVDTIYGHGGLFKTAGVAQQILADALNVPVAVMETAGEGGAWGMALLAAYMDIKDEMPLEQYLSEHVFGRDSGKTLRPDKDGSAGFERYIEKFKATLPVEREACKVFEF